MLNALEPWHLIIILGLVVVLFGAKRLPGSARSLGRSMRILRAEMGHTDEIAPIPTAAPLSAGPIPMPEVAAGSRS